jgi:hypothetical protein
MFGVMRGICMENDLRGVGWKKESWFGWEDQVKRMGGWSKTLGPCKHARSWESTTVTLKCYI